MLREAENKVKIEGILSEIDLKYGSYEKNSKTVETIGGTIKVLVEEKIKDKDVTLEIPVHLFSQKYTKAGGLNPAYRSIETVMTSFTSIAACGSKEQADRVRITNGKIRMNEFWGQSGTLVSIPQIQASFISKAVRDSFHPTAEFALEFMISEMHRVMDEKGIEVDPAILEITAIVPGWNGKVDVCKLRATSPNVIRAIEGYWNPGYCYSGYGRLNFTSRVETVVKQHDFGEEMSETYTRNVSEFIITGGNDTPLNADASFSVEDIKQAMAERNARLDALKTQGVRKSVPSANLTSTKQDLGF